MTGLFLFGPLLGVLTEPLAALLSPAGEVAGAVFFKTPTAISSSGFSVLQELETPNHENDTPSGRRGHDSRWREPYDQRIHGCRYAQASDR